MRENRKLNSNNLTFWAVKISDDYCILQFSFTMKTPMVMLISGLGLF